MKSYSCKNLNTRCGCCYKATPYARTKKTARHKAKLEIKKILSKIKIK